MCKGPEMRPGMVSGRFEKGDKEPYDMCAKMKKVGWQLLQALSSQIRILEIILRTVMSPGERGTLPVAVPLIPSKDCPVEWMLL